MPKIFISFRRDDAAVAQLIYKKLDAHFAVFGMFFDLHKKPFRRNPVEYLEYLEYIEKSVAQSDVLLAVIGDHWLNAQDKAGGRRLDNPNDLVRIEIEAALSRKIPVVPVLVGKASVPDATQLPDSLRELTFRHAAAIRPQTVELDVERLIRDIGKLLLDEHRSPYLSDDDGRDMTSNQNTSVVSTAEYIPPKPTTMRPSTPITDGLAAIGKAVVSIPLICLNAVIGLGSGLASIAGKIGSNAGTSEKPPQIPVPPANGPNNSGGGSGRDGENVEVAVFAPPSVARGNAVLIQVFCYFIGKSNEAKQQAVEFDDDAVRRGFTTLAMPVSHNERLQFHLTLMTLNIESPIRELVWKNVTSSVQFEIQVPKDYPMDNLVGTILISRENVPLGRIGFKLSIISKLLSPHDQEPEFIGESAAKFRKAFVSYSTKDREAVIHRVQMLRPPIVNIDVFQDVFGLEPGDTFSDELYDRIDECDLFLLFWSSNASNSEWVEKEWKHALERQGPEKEPPPTIFPVIIDGPPPVPPPKELNHLNFNDYLLYFTK